MQHSQKRHGFISEAIYLSNVTVQKKRDETFKNHKTIFIFKDLQPRLTCRFCINESSPHVTARILNFFLRRGIAYTGTFLHLHDLLGLMFIVGFRNSENRFAC